MSCIWVPQLCGDYGTNGQREEKDHKITERIICFVKGELGRGEVVEIKKRGF